MSDSGEDDDGAIVGDFLEIATAEVALGFHMADHWLNGGVAVQFALDGTEHAALLAGDENAVWVRRVIAAVSFVDIDALDFAPGAHAVLLVDQAG